MQMTTMNTETQTLENTGVAPGSARGIVWPHDHDENRDIEFHTWGDDLKPASEGITAEDYEFLAAIDAKGGFV
jgi:hypothetical protein